jgi:hypothetical protein
MRVDEEERDIVSQFFSMLGNKDWRHANHSDGTTSPSHRVLTKKKRNFPFSPFC